MTNVQEGTLIDHASSSAAQVAATHGPNGRGHDMTRAGQGAGGHDGDRAKHAGAGPEANRSRMPSQRRDEATLLPPVDVIEDATGITLYADLPGVARDQLDVRVESNTLSIEGELGVAMPQGMSATHAEVQVNRYRRTFMLSDELEGDAVDAELVHGVLRVRIPKAANAQPRRIEVRVA